MAIYHCTVKTHSRRNESTNHAVRSAAYRAGAKLIDANSGNIYNYTRKHEPESVLSSARTRSASPSV